MSDEAPATPLAITVPEPTEPSVVLSGEIPYLAVHRHYTIQNMEHTLSHPRRIDTSIQFDDPQSFAEYLNHMAPPDSHCLVTYEAAVNDGVWAVKFLAVLDYHDANANPQAKPQWCKHKAYYVPRFSDQFALWMGKHLKVFTPTDFGEFVEDNAADFVEPAAARMIDIAMNLHLAKAVAFKRHERREDGSLTYHFDESVTPTGPSAAGGDIAIPHSFRIRMPVFHGCQPADIDALFRYRANRDSGITFHYKIPAVNRLVRDAIAGPGGLVETLNASITTENRGLPLLNGKFVTKQT